MEGTDLTRSGIYTASEAAALIGVSERKIRGWVAGWPGSGAPPVVTNDLGWVNGKLAFSFANLMELRFIAFFEDAGVRFKKIRAIMEEVRTAIHRPHPFATNIVFKTDGQKIVAEIFNRNGKIDLFDLQSRNFEMGVIVYKSLKQDVVYDPKGDAQAWYPRKKVAPNIIIHPSISFGRPVVKGRGVPTDTLANAVKVEGSIELAAEIFEIPERYIREAVCFENSLRRAA